MKQILHIFWKDARRLWIEILLSLVMAALFAWVTPKSWLSENVSSIREIAKLLVPVSWWLIIARLIHSEGLVGDRQFWVTRPYEWPKLLAAKALFVTLFVYLPFLLMGVSILLQAGFNPLSYIPGLLYRLFLISVVFFPLIGLAAVTSNLARMVLTILGLYVAYVVIWSTFAVPSDGNNAPVTYTRVPLGGLASVAAVLLVCGAAVVLQYARRRVLMARLLLGSAPFLVLLASFICNRSVWMNWAYPPIAQTQPAIIRMIPFEQDKKRQSGIPWGMSESGDPHFDPNKWSMVKVELRASGVAVGDRWQLEAFRPTFTPANGASLKLDWQQGQEVFDTPDDPNDLHYYVLTFLILRADYEKLKSSPLTLHLDFALTQARTAWSRRFGLPEGNFIIPGFASCSLAEDRLTGTPGLGMKCHFPLRPPTLTTVTAFQMKDRCLDAPAPADDPKLAASTSFGDFDSAPASFGLSPIEEGSLSAHGGSWWSGRDHYERWVGRLCPGVPVVITQYRKVRTVQTGVTIENFNISTRRGIQRTEY